MGTQHYVPGDWAIISGWGTLESGGKQPDRLQEANVTIISRDDCNYGSGKYNGKILESMICAGIPNVGGKDACQGDSGGPMVSLINGSFELVGATSWGIGCADGQFPGVYADVYFVLDWVKSSIGAKDGCPRASTTPSTSAPPSTTAPPPSTGSWWWWWG